jgi:IS4 transposase
LSLQPEHPVKVWIKDLEIEVVLCKFVFTNKDGSTGEMYLVSNDSELSADDFRTLYKKRWSVEEYHKSLKQNTSLTKSPTRTVATQTAHLFASLVAYVKLERLKFVHNLNHFALKAKVYLTAIRMAWKELGELKNYTIA